MLKVHFNFKPLLGLLAMLIFVVSFSKFFVTPTLSASGINRFVNFQGKLVNNPAGTNVSNTSYTVIFTIYDKASGGTALWTETQTVTTADGIFRVALGSVTPIPSNFNFNWSDLFLGMKVNADAEMTPRVQLAAVPYAFNAEKVSGLTVQDDSGNASTSATLRIGNSKTVTFAGSNGLTFNDPGGATTITLPNTGSITLVDTATTQTLTNKIIGSTGLTFNGANTDITTGTNEDFVLSPNGSGKVGINAASPLATFDVRGNLGSGTIGIASFSGTTSFSTLVADNGGAGDIFSASKSGGARFTIKGNGAIIANAYQTCTLKTDSNGLVSCGVDNTGTGGYESPFRELSGTIIPLNSTEDFLLGGQATTSAKFSISGIANNQALASLSGSLVVMPSNGWGGQIAVNKTSALAGVDIKDTSSLAVLGSEKITATADRDFSSSTGNWTAPGGWTILGGVLNKNAAGTGAVTLSNTALDSAPVAGSAYQVVFTFTTTASSSGTIVANLGGTDGVTVGQDINNFGTQTQIIFAVNTNALKFTPTIGWFGTIDNVSLKLISGSSITLRLEASNGTSSPIEFRAGRSGGQNISIGQNAGKFITSGFSNTFIGNVAGVSNTTGFSNTFIGNGAGFSNTTGTGNSFLGDQAGASNTTGTGNSFLGYQSGIFNSTGTTNTFVGNQAGYNNTIGSNNSFLGYQTGQNNTTGFGNSFIGYQTGQNNTTGSGNSFLGYQAGQTNALISNGNNNTFLGYQAGQTNALANNGSNNTFVGYQAGILNTLGGLNTVLGYSANVGSGNLTNAAAIGSNALVNQDNSLVLGSIAGFNSATASARIGIGTVAPTATLDVQGGNWGGRAALIVNQTGNSANDIFSASSSGTTRFMISNAGSVGIGTSSPLATLDLRGNLGSGTTPIASISGTTSFASLIANNNGVGDIFTASKAGSSRFSIAGNGAITANAYQTCTLKTDSNGLVTCGVDNTGGGSGNSPFAELSGAIVANNSTEDFLVGGQSTSSALFRISGKSPFAGTTSVASISALTSYAAFVIDNQSKFGDLFTASASGATRFTITNQGNVNIVGGVGVGGNSATATGINITRANSTDTGIAFGQASGGTGISFSNLSDTAVGINLGTQTIAAVNGFTGKYLSIGNTSTQYLGGSSVTETGNYLTVSRNNTVGNAGKTVTVTGDLSNLSSTCSVTLGQCIDSSSVLSLTQSYASASGAVLKIINNGTGTGLNISGIGSIAPVASLSGRTSYAALVANNDGVGDLFTASKAGSSRFTIAGNGAITANAYKSCNLETDANGIVTCGVDDTGGGGSSSPFAELSGAIVANNSTEDFLFGSQATTSARFRLTANNLGAGTLGVASISGNTSFATLLVDNSGTGDLLTGSTSGTKKFSFNNNGELTIFPNSIDNTSYLNPGGTGNRQATITVTSNFSIGGNIQHFVDGTLTDDSWFNGAGAASGQYLQFDFGNGATKRITEAIFYQSSAVTHGVWRWQGSNDAANWTNIGNTFTFGGSTAQTQTELSGNLDVYRYYRLLGVSGTSQSGPWIREFEFKIADIAGGSAGTIVKSDSIGVGTLTPSVSLEVLGETRARKFAFQDSTSVYLDTLGSNILTLATSSQDRLVINESGLVGVGTSAPLANLDIRGSTSHLAVASVSGTTSFATLIANNNGVGDIFTASKSGGTRFIIAGNGAITANAYQTCTLKTDSTGLVTCGVDNTGSGGGDRSPFSELSGAIIPNNSTEDFLIGGQATTSAKFSISGIANNQALASLSGSLVVMPSNGWGGQISVNKTTALAGVDIKDTNSLAVLGSEKITATADRDFSSDTGNWTDLGEWTIVGGKLTKDSAGAGPVTLSNTALDSAPVAGNTYQLTFTYTTTASASGGLTPNIGGTNGPSIAFEVNGSDTRVLIITAINTSALKFTPQSNWYGTLDNVSIKQITSNSIAFRLESSNGTSSPIEFRTGGSGLNNIFIGQNSGMPNTSGSNNTFIGKDAGSSNTTGFDNAFLGYQAGQNNYNAAGSVFLGVAAGANSSGGIRNVFIGYQTGLVNSTGNFNTFLGTQVGGANKTGSNNAFLGSQTGISNVSGSFNTFVGPSAGSSNTLASNNSFLGYRAGRNTTIGENNAFMGYQAGDHNTVGGLNTVLGYLADVGSGNLINAGAIGALALVNQDNSLVLGSIAGLNSATASARIGIGTIAPLVALDVRGSSSPLNVASISGTTSMATLIVNNDSRFGDLFTASASGATRFVINNQGYVGIGTNLPTYNLQVNGTTNTTNLMAHDLIVATSSASILTGYKGFSGYTNFSGGIGTGGTDSILNAQRLTSTGNLTNIGSIQSGELLVTNGGLFAPKVDYSAGTLPQSVAIGDLNGDGKLDMAVTNSTGTNTVSVFINNGNGTFATNVDYPTSSTPRQVAIADLNGDGKLDMAIAASNVSIYINKGDGTFAPKVDYTTGLGPLALAIGDLNGDGKLDIVTSNTSTTTVSVLINNGNGTFANKVDYTVGSLPFGVAIGDLNGDGKADLVVSNSDNSAGGNSVSVLINNGNGTFATKVDYPTGTGPIGVSIGDLNGDGKGDLVVSNNTSSTLSVFMNLGNGTFATKQDYSTGSSPYFNAIGDLNGDGKADLAIPNGLNGGGGNTVSVFINLGNGTFAPKADYATGKSPDGVAIGDLNGDGKADLAVANGFNGGGGNSVSVLINQSNPLLFAQAVTGRVGIGISSTPSATFDVRGTFQQNAGTLAVASVSGNTSFAAMVVNNDSGVGDLFTASASGATRFVIRQNGSVGIGTNIPQASGLSVVQMGSVAPTQDLVGITNLAGQEPTANGVNALQLNWLVKPAGSANTAAERIQVGNNNTGTGGTATGLRIVATGAGGVINSPTVGLYVDGLSSASVGTTAQNGIQIGGNWDSSIFGEGDLRINAGGNIFLSTNSGSTKFLFGNYGPTASTSNFDIRATGNPSVNAGISIASISGRTSFAGLVVNNDGRGDVFTASSSGTTRFRIAQNGSVLMQGASVASIGIIKAGAANESNDYAVINAQGDQGGMVPNGGFESAIGGVTFADGWVNSSTSTAAVTRDTAAPGSGNANLLVTNNGAQVADLYSACIPLTGGQVYALSFMQKGSLAAGLIVRSYIKQYTTQGNCQTNTSATTTASSSVAALTTSYAGVGTTTLTLAAATTWGRVNILVGGPTSGRTASIDSIRLVPNAVNNGLDYAEVYPADASDTIESGDIVSLQAGAQISQVSRSKKYMDNSVIGIVSTQPGQVLDDGSVPDPKVPVALAGRVPVKVSTLNGDIKTGDYLTSSTMPGVAVKAINAGPVIGIAMEDYSNADTMVIGKVTIFIKNTYYNGKGLTELAGLTSDDNKNVFLKLTDSGSFMIKNSSGAGAITFDDKGNALFAGTITADKIKANSIEGLDVISNKIDNLAKKVDILENLFSKGSVLGSATESGELNISTESGALSFVSGNLNIKGNTLVNGMLTVLSSISAPNLIISDFASFFGDVVFKKNVKFEKPPVFSSDTAGFAVIKKGDTSVTVNFDEEYPNTPVVTASIALDKITDDDKEQALEDTILNGNLSYIVSKKTTKGFTIRINKAQSEDVPFSWVSVSVDKVKTSESGVPALTVNSSATASAAFQSILNQLNSN